MHMAFYIFCLWQRWESSFDIITFCMKTNKTLDIMGLDFLFGKKITSESQMHWGRSAIAGVNTENEKKRDSHFLEKVPFHILSVLLSMLFIFLSKIYMLPSATGVVLFSDPDYLPRKNMAVKNSCLPPWLPCLPACRPCLSDLWVGCWAGWENRICVTGRWGQPCHKAGGGCGAILSHLWPNLH